MTTYQQYTNGLYAVMYGRVADQHGYSYWLNQEGVTASQAATTAIPAATEQSIADQFYSTQATYFNSVYGGLSDTNFILALYQNLGGNTTGVSGADISYWQAKLTAAGGDRAALAGEFTDAFISYNGTDVSGLARQASFDNEIAVSESWVNASATNPFMNAITTTDPAFASEQAILTGANATPSYLLTAIGQIDQAVSTQSLAGVVGVPGNTITTIQLQPGPDNVHGTSGNDLISGTLNFDSSGNLDNVTSTYNPGDIIDGGAGVNTLKITLADQNGAFQNVSLGGTTIANIQNLIVDDSGNGLDYYDLYLPTNAFQSVTFENVYGGYIYGVNEGTAATVLVGPQNGGLYGYGEIYNDIYFNGTTASSVTMNDTLQGNPTEANGEYHEVYFEHGDTGVGLQNATTINATLNLLNAHSALNEGDYAYQYIYADNAGNAGAAFTTTLNVSNATSDGTEYSEAEQYIYQDGGASSVNATVNVTNSVDVWAGVYANENGSATANAANNTVTVNLDNVSGTYGDTGVGVYGFDTVNVNVTGKTVLDYGLEAYESDTTYTDANSQTVTIAASADFKTYETELDYKGSVHTVVTGSGNVDLGYYYASSSSTLSSTVVSSIDASGLTGNFSVDVEDAINSVKGGAGNDVILIENVSTFGSTALGGLVLDGGAGSNTVGFADAGWATVAAGASADLAKITHFQTLEITNALDTAAGASTTYDVSLLSGSAITSFVAADGVVTATTATVDNLGANASVTLAGDLNTYNGQLDLALKTDTPADTLNLVLNGNYYDDNNTTSVVAQAFTETVDTSNVETLNVTSTAHDTHTFTPVFGYAADTVTNTLALTDTALKALVISGDQALIYTAAAGNTALTSIDASANTAGVTIDVGNAALTQGITIKGTVGADLITVGSGADLVTLNGGVDTVNFAQKSASSAVFTSVNDIASKDVLEFSNLASLTNADGKIGAALTSGVNDYQTFLNAGASKAAGTVSWFEWGGDTYVVESAGNSTFTAGSDSVIKLVGLHDLSTSVIAGSGTAHGTLTLA